MRKIDPFAFVWTLLLGSMSGRVRQLSELRRAFERVARVTIEESSFYDRFTPALSAMLCMLLERVLAHSLGSGRRARGRLAAFASIMVADSTVVRLHRLFAKAFPGMVRGKLLIVDLGYFDIDSWPASALWAASSSSEPRKASTPSSWIATPAAEVTPLL